MLLLVGLLLAVLFAPQGLARSEYAAWTWFHYYLGSKYFAELGYFDIYEQTVVAQRERGGPLAKPELIRDLHTYERVAPRPDLGRSPRWTEARWQEFGDDIDVMLPEMPQLAWFDVLRDRGYNATPPWSSVAGWMTGALSVRSPTHRALMKAVDVVGLAVVVGVFLALFGAGRTGLFVLALALFPTTGARFLGTLVQYDWLAVLCLAVAAAAAGRRGWLGFLIGVAAAMRVFPLVFVGGTVAFTAFHLWDRRGLPAGTGRFLLGLLAALSLAGILGSVGPRGLNAWPEFAEKIAVHDHHHRYGSARVGLAHVFTRDGWGHHAPKEEARPVNLERLAPLRWAASLGLLCLLALALRRRDELDSILLMLVAFFVLSVASRYYWSLLALLPLLGSRSSLGRTLPRVGVALSLGPTLLFFAHLPLHHSWWSRWVFFNEVLALGFAVGLGLIVREDVRVAGGWAPFLRRGVATAPGTSAAR